LRCNIAGWIRLLSLPGSRREIRSRLCDAGAATVVCWEDEQQPGTARIWWHSVKLLKAARIKVMIFNGDKPLAPDFSGRN
jgi:hypothetical protein